MAESSAILEAEQRIEEQQESWKHGGSGNRAAALKYKKLLY